MRIADLREDLEIIGPIENGNTLLYISAARLNAIHRLITKARVLVSQEYTREDSYPRDEEHGSQPPTSRR